MSAENRTRPIRYAVVGLGHIAQIAGYLFLPTRFAELEVNSARL
jgi:hypothetical protein